MLLASCASNKTESSALKEYLEAKSKLDKAHPLCLTSLPGKPESLEMYSKRLSNVAPANLKRLSDSVLEKLESLADSSKNFNEEGSAHPPLQIYSYFDGASGYSIPSCSYLDDLQMIEVFSKKWRGYGAAQKKAIWQSIKSSLLQDSNSALSVNFLSFGFGILYQTTTFESFDLSADSKKEIISALTLWNAAVQKYRKEKQGEKAGELIHILSNTTLDYIKLNRPHWHKLQSLLKKIEVSR